MNDNFRRMASLVVLMATVSAGPAALAGRSGGPASTMDRVQAFDTDVYAMQFAGGRTARIVVDGDGDTDLDLFVYDEFGNLIDSDTDGTDYCVASWTPAWTGTFRIEIRNFGDVYNQYRIQTN